ncbi:MAG: hypothetical protein JRI97_09280, partial [Deltaproteobacteria bacterium]|nr:hypothetical protein [Deltaproteobacteria bacterium]
SNLTLNPLLLDAGTDAAGNIGPAGRSYLRLAFPAFTDLAVDLPDIAVQPDVGGVPGPVNPSLGQLHLNADTAPIDLYLYGGGNLGKGIGLAGTLTLVGDSFFAGGDADGVPVIDPGQGFVTLQNLTGVLDLSGGITLDAAYDGTYSWARIDFPEMLVSVPPPGATLSVSPAMGGGGPATVAGTLAGQLYLSDSTYFDFRGGAQNAIGMSIGGDFDLVDPIANPAKPSWLAYNDTDTANGWVTLDNVQLDYTAPGPGCLDISDDWIRFHWPAFTGTIWIGDLWTGGAAPRAGNSAGGFRIDFSCPLVEWGVTHRSNPAFGLGGGAGMAWRAEVEFINPSNIGWEDSDGWTGTGGWLTLYDILFYDGAPGTPVLLEPLQINVGPSLVQFGLPDISANLDVADVIVHANFAGAGGSMGGLRARLEIPATGVVLAPH